MTDDEIDHIALIRRRPALYVGGVSSRWLFISACCVFAVVLDSACGGASATSDSAGSTTSVEREPAPATSGSTHPALAPLRPAGADVVLQALASSPADAAAYVAAARFYAGTDAGGMTLLWGLTCYALDPTSSQCVDATAAMLSVLQNRITITRDGDTKTVSTRLAPGATPAIARDDGAILAPVAHLFEHQVAASLAAFDGQWTLAAVVSCWSTYAALLQQRPSPFSPLDDVVELHRWLSAAATAGHLEALVVNAFGAHFQTERASYESAHPGALDAARTWAVTHSFRPIHAVLPDDLVRIR